MPESSARITPEDLIQFIRGNAPELLGKAMIDASFSDMDVDSLSLVEIAVMVSEKYAITIQDWEIAESGDFLGLADLLNSRLLTAAPR